MKAHTENKAAGRALCGRKEHPMKYILKQRLKDGAIWTSPVTFEHEPGQIPQVVIAGFLLGEPRWAERPDGTFLYGLDAKGKGLERAP
jgi:hypothetical protein